MTAKSSSIGFRVSMWTNTSTLLQRHTEHIWFKCSLFHRSIMGRVPHTKTQLVHWDIVCLAGLRNTLLSVTFWGLSHDLRRKSQRLASPRILRLTRGKTRMIRPAAPPNFCWYIKFTYEADRDPFVPISATYWFCYTHVSNLHFPKTSIKWFFCVAQGRHFR